MRRAEVVQLHRKLRPRDADRREQLRLVVVGPPRRDRLLHPAEDDPGALALEQHRHDAGARLEPDLDELERRAEHERGSEDRVPRERQLGRRGEDPDPHVPVRLRPVDVDRLGQVQLPRQRLEHVLGQVGRVGEDRELVARQRPVGEDVDDGVAEGRHVFQPTAGSILGLCASI